MNCLLNPGLTDFCKRGLVILFYYSGQAVSSQQNCSVLAECAELQIFFDTLSVRRVFESAETGIGDALQRIQKNRA